MLFQFVPPYLKHAGTVLPAEMPGQPFYFKSVFIPMCLVFSVLFMLYFIYKIQQ